MLSVTLCYKLEQGVLDSDTSRIDNDYDNSVTAWWQCVCMCMCACMLTHIRMCVCALFRLTGISYDVVCVVPSDMICADL